MMRRSCTGRSGTPCTRRRWPSTGLSPIFRTAFIGRLLYRIIFPLGHPYDVPSDRIGHQVARLLISPSPARDRLTAETYLPKFDCEPVGAIELALQATLDAEPFEARIRAAEKNGVFDNIPEANVRDSAQVAFSMGLITDEEYVLLKKRNRLRDIVIHVDDFPFDFGLARNQPAAHEVAAWIDLATESECSGFLGRCQK